MSCNKVSQIEGSVDQTKGNPSTYCASGNEKIYISYTVKMCIIKGILREKKSV